MILHYVNNGWNAGFVDTDEAKHAIIGEKTVTKYYKTMYWVVVYCSNSISYKRDRERERQRWKEDEIE